MKRYFKGLLSLILSLTMTSQYCLPAWAEEVEEDVVEEVVENEQEVEPTQEEPIQEEENNTAEEEEEIFEFSLEDVEEEIYEYDLDSAEVQNQVILKQDGNRYANYIDRVDVESEYVDFYNQLVTAAADTSSYLYRTESGVETYNGSQYIMAVEKTFEVRIDESTVDQSDLSTALYNQIALQMGNWQGQMLSVFYAFTNDHPEVFWLRGSIMEGYSYSTTGGRLVDGQYVFPEVTVSICVYLNSDSYSLFDSNFVDQASIISSQNSMNQVVQTIVASTNGMSRYDALDTFNSWLVDNNEYNSVDTSYRMAHNCLSALVLHEGINAPVCEGYSKALKVLCDQAGIPCVLEVGLGYSSPTSSEGHEWCLVQMNDGNWYAIDTTWNDPVVIGGGQQSQSARHEYFLVGSTTVIDDMTFSESHQTTAEIFEGGFYNNGPILSESAYQNIEPTHVQYLDFSNWQPIKEEDVYVSEENLQEYFYNNAMEGYAYIGISYPLESGGVQVLMYPGTLKERSTITKRYYSYATQQRILADKTFTVPYVVIETENGDYTFYKTEDDDELLNNTYCREMSSPTIENGKYVVDIEVVRNGDEFDFPVSLAKDFSNEEITSFTYTTEFNMNLDVIQQEIEEYIIENYSQVQGYAFDGRIEYKYPCSYEAYYVEGTYEDCIDLNLDYISWKEGTFVGTCVTKAYVIQDADGNSQYYYNSWAGNPEYDEVITDGNPYYVQEDDTWHQIVKCVNIGDEVEVDCYVRNRDALLTLDVVFSNEDSVWHSRIKDAISEIYEGYCVIDGLYGISNYYELEIAKGVQANLHVTYIDYETKESIFEEDIVTELTIIEEENWTDYRFNEWPNSEEFPYEHIVRTSDPVQREDGDYEVTLYCLKEDATVDYTLTCYDTYTGVELDLVELEDFTYVDDYDEVLRQIQEKLIQEKPEYVLDYICVNGPFAAKAYVYDCSQAEDLTRATLNISYYDQNQKTVIKTEQTTLAICDGDYLYSSFHTPEGYDEYIRAYNPVLFEEDGAYEVLIHCVKDGDSLPISVTFYDENGILKTQEIEIEYDKELGIWDTVQNALYEEQKTNGAFVFEYVYEGDFDLYYLQVEAKLIPGNDIQYNDLDIKAYDLTTKEELGTYTGTLLTFNNLDICLESRYYYDSIEMDGYDQTVEYYDEDENRLNLYFFNEEDEVTVTINYIDYVENTSVPVEITIDANDLHYWESMDAHFEQNCPEGFVKEDDYGSIGVDEFEVYGFFGTQTETTVLVRYFDWSTNRVASATETSLKVNEYRNGNIEYRYDRDFLEDYDYTLCTGNPVEQEDGTYIVDHLCVNKNETVPVTIHYMYEGEQIDSVNITTIQYTEDFIQDVQDVVGDNMPNDYRQTQDGLDCSKFKDIYVEVKSVAYLSGYSVNLERDGGILLNAFVDSNRADEISTVRIKMMKNGQEAVLSEQSIAQGIEAEHGIQFQVPVSAKDMTQDIIIELEDEDGNNLRTYRTSINEYATDALEECEDDNVGEIIRTMLTYGKNTQTYFNYNLGVLPTLGWEETFVSDEDILKGCQTFTELNKTDDVFFVGARLVLSSNLGLKLYFINQSGNVLQAEGATISNEGKYTVLTFDDVDAFTTYSVSMNGSNYALNYGVTSFVQRALNTNDENLKNLVRSLYTYYDVLNQN